MVCVRKCMCVVLNQQKNGVSDSTVRSSQSSACSSTSSSMVSIRLLVSGPVSSIRCRPTRPNRGSSVGSSSLRGPRVDDAARAEAIVEAGELVRRRPVRQLGLLLRVEVVEVAEELVEAVDGRQVLVQVAEVVLAELAGGIAVRLEQLGDRHVLGLQADVRTRHPDLAQAGAEHALAGDERGAPGGAALLAVGVGEAHPLVGDPVDVRRPVAHQPVAVTAQVRDPDVVAPDHQDVGLVRHGSAPLALGSPRILASRWVTGPHPRRVTRGAARCG